MYNDYIMKITKLAGYSPVREKIEPMSNLLKDEYVKRALVSKLLVEGVIDKNLANILLTKTLVNNYI